MARIELDPTSCNREQVSAITSLIGASGEGRNDTGDGHVLFNFDETMVDGYANIMDLSAASQNAVSLGDWETSL